MKSVCGILAGALVVLSSSCAAAEAVALRGYGKVAAEFGRDVAVFSCEDRACAETVYAKLLRDIPQCAADAPRVPYAVGMRSNCVYVVSSFDRKEVERTVSQYGLETPPPVRYAHYLDYFDLKALKFYARPMDSLHGFGVENHWPFARRTGIEGLVFHGISFHETKGPDLFSFQPWDHGVANAEKNDAMVTLCPQFAGLMPQWYFERHPGQCAKVQAHTLVTEWIQGVEGMPFDGDGKPLPPARDPQISFQKQVIERYRGSPALGGWQFYCGKPIGDQFGMGMEGVLWDASPEAFKAQKEWLKGKYSLEALSSRWTDRPDAYRDWDDVPPMQLIDLIGGDWDEERWDLRDCVWHWAKAPEKTFWKGAAGWVDDGKVAILTPPGADAKWVRNERPPSNRNNFLEQGRSWNRVRLKKCDWLEKNRHKTLYLRSVAYLMDRGPVALWANGKATKGAGGGVCEMFGLAIEPGTFKNDGKDEIIVELPGGRCGGRFAGPITLSPNPVQNFPYADKTVNARYLDNILFQNDKIIARNLRVFLMGRALDPNRPIALSGADGPIFSKLAHVWAENGFALQSTSTDGFYWPLIPDLGRQHGFYFIGEPSRDVADEERFDRNFGTIFYSGASSTAIFMDIEQYMKFDRETGGGLRKRRPITRLVGKYLIDEPRTALYFSTWSLLCRTGAPYHWNLARGEAQAVHHDTAMLNEITFAQMKDAHLRYPLLLDCGADVMDEAMVAGIARYVEAGGTFVAFSETGRHTPYEKDVHPLARVSGFRTKDLDAAVTSLAFEDQDVFPLWAGKTFRAHGYGTYTQANGMWNRSLESTAPDAQVLARWSDGTIAAGVRRLGKGRILTLASGFWREARDINGKWVPSRYNERMDQLFRQLGAKRNTDATSYHIWTRKGTSKNGMEDWLIGFNVAYDPQTQRAFAVTGDVSMAVSARPARVIDAFTRKDVAWTYEDGCVKIKNVAFGPFKTRIFAAARPCSVVRGLETWWAEKTRYWRRAPAHPVPRVQVKKDDIVAFDEWDFTVDPDGKTWRKARNATWKIQFPDLKDYAGKATYRARFRLPGAPEGGRCVLRFSHAAIYDKAQIRVNGATCGAFDRSRMHHELCGDCVFDISRHVRAGAENELEVDVTGGSSSIAGICDLIWIYREKVFKEEIDLSGDWTLVMKDFLSEKKGTVPGTNFCRYMKKTFKVPAVWKGKKAFVRIVHPENTIGAILVNGRSRNLPGMGHVPFANREEIYIGDLLKSGEENTLEIWHRHTIPVDWKGKSWGWPLESTYTLHEVVLGIVESF